QWSAPWVGKVGSKGWMSVRAAATAVRRNKSLAALLQDCVAFTGDVDTVATIALAAASCSREYEHDLPPALVEGLENGAYGHDYARLTLRDRPAFTQLFAELRLACVCPAGGRSWWADRLCPEFDARVTPERYLLQSVVPFFQQRWELGPRAAGLLGIGMGGQG